MKTKDLLSNMKTILTDKVIDSTKIKPMENDKGFSVKTMRVKRPFPSFFSPFLKTGKKCQLWPSMGYIVQLKSSFRSIFGKKTKIFHLRLFFVFCRWNVFRRRFVPRNLPYHEKLLVARLKGKPWIFAWSKYLKFWVEFLKVKQQTIYFV